MNWFVLQKEKVYAKNVQLQHVLLKERKDAKDLNASAKLGNLPFLLRKSILFSQLDLQV